MHFWKKSHGLTMPDRWFLKHCKMKHAISIGKQPGRSHADTKSALLVKSWLCLQQSAYHGGCVSPGLIYTGPAGQAEQASKCNGSATGFVQTKVRSNATTRAFIAQGELWLQLKEEGTGTTVTQCELYPQHQPPDGKGGSSYMWVTRAALWQVVHACRRGCGHLPFLTKLGLYLGL